MTVAFVIFPVLPKCYSRIPRLQKEPSIAKKKQFFEEKTKHKVLLQRNSHPRKVLNLSDNVDL
jgi:hypothetical protein